MNAPKQELETLAAWGTECLEAVIAIESQSDESSRTIPSTEGQRRLCEHLRGHFAALGYDGRTDPNGNLLVHVPSNLPVGREAPAVALMVHVDTAHGTHAVPALERVRAWKGDRVRYPANDRLHVSAEDYPYLRAFVGDDLLHGPGDFPVGFDDKLGMAELMLLARVLRENPELEHGDVWLVFRPDEEIGRMEAVEGLARELVEKGVRYGYTVDGIVPFEINVENFNAARATVRIAGRPLAALPSTKRITVAVKGVNTHGATAQAEGHLNALAIFARAYARLDGRAEVVALGFETDPDLECNARIELAATAAGEAALLEAFEAEVAPARRRGADLAIVDRKDHVAPATDAALRLYRHLREFLESDGPRPRLAEESGGFEGYSSPHRVRREGDALVLDYRLRDFDPGGLERRKQHVRAVAATAGLPIEVQDQYVNMGPKLKEHPELVRWAEAALAPLGVQAPKMPIRGGTGVDPFLERGIPVANLGTGYFAPESEKELTSRQNVARHGLWLAYLVQALAR